LGGWANTFETGADFGGRERGVNLPLTLFGKGPYFLGQKGERGLGEEFAPRLNWN